MRNKRLLDTVGSALLAATLAVGCVQQNSGDASKSSEPRPFAARLDSLTEASSEDTPPAVLEAGRKGLEELIAARIVDKALNVGAKAPTFALSDARGKTVGSTELLAAGPVVLVFYRGAWCPYCNLYLHEMQQHADEIRAHGASLVAISGESPDNTLSVEEKHALEFTVLSDPQFTVARQFGIVYEMPKVVNDVILDLGFDLAKYYGTDKAELPLSATYVIGRDGKIAYAFLDPDYKHRAEPRAILKALSRLR